MGAQMWGKSLVALIAITLIITVGYIATSRNFAKIYSPNTVVAAEEAEDESSGNWSIFV
jgi:hypothetical protein